MFTLVYDLGMWDDESVYEEFDTIEELLTRYEELKYDACEFRAFDDDGRKFAPWWLEKNF